MKYQRLLPLAVDQPLVETQMLVAMGEKPSHLSVQLTRWVRAGKLVQLRRGLYLLPEELRSKDVALEQVANFLLRPSYVSLEYALALYGLIPETVHLVQSVATRRPASFHTLVGDFRFRYVKASWFFGYQEVEVSGGRALVARPEKALLDLFHLGAGEWDQRRIEGLRLQNLELLDAKTLFEMAERTASPRVEKAARRVAVMIAEESGTRTVAT